MPTFTKTFRQIREMKDFSATLGGGTDGYFVRYNNSTGLFDLAAVPPPPSTYPISQINGVTPGSVLFGGAAGAIAQDNANLFFDDTSNRLGIGTITPGAALQVNGAASGITAIFRANATTPDNITEWQNSSGVVITRVSSGGDFVLRSSDNTLDSVTISRAGNIAFSGSGSGTVSGTNLLLSAQGGLTSINLSNGTGFITLSTNTSTVVTTTNAARTPLIVQGAASQTANLTEWQNSSGTVLAGILASGSFGCTGTIGVGGGSFNGRDLVAPAGNTMRLGDSNQVAIAPFGGGITTPGLVSSASATINAASAATIALTVKGAPSQSANIIEVQNSSGTALSYFDSAGRVRLPAGAPSTLSLSFVGDTTTGFYQVASGTASFVSSGVTQWIACANTSSGSYPKSLRLRVSMMLGFSPGNPDASAEDVGIVRSAAGVLKVTDGVDGLGGFICGAQTPGNETLRIQTAATNDDPTVSVYQNRVATTDATQTTLHTITLADDTVYAISVRVLARRTGGSAGAAGDSAIYERTVRAKRTSGGGATLGSISPVFTDEDDASWDCTFTVSGNDVRVSVTGGASVSITWHLLKCEVSPLSS